MIETVLATSLFFNLILLALVREYRDDAKRTYASLLAANEKIHKARSVLDG